MAYDPNAHVKAKQKKRNKCDRQHEIRKILNGPDAPMTKRELIAKLKAEGIEISDRTMRRYESEMFTRGEILVCGDAYAELLKAAN